MANFSLEQQNFMNTMLQILNALGFVYTIYIIIMTSCKKSDKISKKLRYITIIHVLCYSIRFATFFAYIMIPKTYNDIQFYVITVSNGFWVLGVVLFYSLLVFRLYMIFKDSVYHLKRYHIISYIILVALIAPLWTLACSLKTNKYIYVFAVILINIYIGISVSIIFVKNLLSLVIVTSTSTTTVVIQDVKTASSSSGETRSTPVPDTPPTPKLDKTQTVLIKTATKTAILCIFGLIFYQVLLIFWGVLNVLIQHDYNVTHYGYIAVLISHSLMFISIWMEIHSVYLSFNYNDKQYHTLCCLCHNCMEKCFASSTQKRINEPHF